MHAYSNAPNTMSVGSWQEVSEHQFCAHWGLAKRAHRKYLVVILRPSRTGVFCPTACLTIQLPCVTRGIILNALWRRTVVAASPPASSRNLAPHQGSELRTHPSKLH